ncbi:hypothetical protein [Nesterenkonia pannonica]|uniref:hypothetical protein n=1 Tax=Nesterenkonia pannonica TaxID=1548602 RepID=UPI0021642D80|nr:hypothetical protein [Nesterenkonia pannonica]
MSEYYQLGRSHSAPHAIASIADPPTAEEMTRLADRVLSGMHDGDVDVAFDRAAAFCRVIARGQALWADQRGVSSGDAQRLTSRANQLVRTAEELELSARSYRVSTLD